MFIGSDLSTGKFFRCFSFFNDRHKLSKSARDDLLNLFSTTLTRPNTIKTKKYVQLIPNIVASEGESNSIAMIDLLSQLSKVVQRNSKKILKSWSSNCSWLDPRDNFKDREVHLVLSLDRRSLCLQVTEHFSLACLGTITKFTSAFKILYQKFGFSCSLARPEQT